MDANIYSGDETGQRVSQCSDKYCTFPLETIYQHTLLIASAPEMLEALIEIVQTNMTYVEQGEIDIEDIQKELGIIERATGKSWSEIKEMLV